MSEIMVKGQAFRLGDLVEVDGSVEEWYWQSLNLGFHHTEPNLVLVNKPRLERSSFLAKIMLSVFCSGEGLQIEKVEGRNKENITSEINPKGTNYVVWEKPLRPRDRYIVTNNAGPQWGIAKLEFYVPS
jgi:hypothetical protein